MMDDKTLTREEYQGWVEIYALRESMDEEKFRSYLFNYNLRYKK